jgi:PAS domain S-box-containing protein
VITYNPNGEIISMNAAAQELLGVSMDDFNRVAIPERMRLMKVKTVEGAEQEPDRSPTVWALTGKIVRGEIRIVENPRTGRVIWTDNSAAPVYSSDGRLLGAVATFTDITGLKLAEEALRKSEEMYRVLAENSDDLIHWSAEGHEFPDLQVGDEVNPRPFFMPL